MSMTRQHFEAIAAVLRSNQDRSSDFERFRTETIALEMAATLARFNPSFDRARFLTACGIAAPAHTFPCYSDGATFVVPTS